MRTRGTRGLEIRLENSLVDSWNLALKSTRGLESWKWIFKLNLRTHKSTWEILLQSPHENLIANSSSCSYVDTGTQGLARWLAIRLKDSPVDSRNLALQSTRGLESWPMDLLLSWYEDLTASSWTCDSTRGLVTRLKESFSWVDMRTRSDSWTCF